MLNIFPGCQSLLHKLAIGNKEMVGLELTLDSSQATDSTFELFQTAKKKFNFGLMGTDGEVSLEIPLL